MKYRILLRALAASVACSICLSGANPASAGDDWPYQWPVLAPIVDPFRAPASPYAPGNRGIEFATFPRTPVLAAASGTVSFAGQVGGQIWVTVDHPDGVRTSYGPLGQALASRGHSVSRGQQIGITGGRLHVSARIGTAYVDPAVLFGGSLRVRLIPTRRSTLAAR